MGDIAADRPNDQFGSLSQTSHWKFVETENEKTLSRTMLDESEFLCGEFDHISKIKRPYDQDLSRSKSKKVFAKITKGEKTITHQNCIRPFAQSKIFKHIHQLGEK